MKENETSKKSLRDSLIVLLVLLAVAVTSGYFFFKTNKKTSSEATAAPSASATAAAEEKMSYWVVEPSDAAQGIRIFEAHTDQREQGDAGLEKTGYPMSWDRGHGVSVLPEETLGVDLNGVLVLYGPDGAEIRSTDMTLTDTDGTISYDAVTHCFVYQAGGRTYRISQDFSTLSDFAPAAQHTPKNRGYALQNDVSVYIEGGLNGKEAKAQEKALDCGGVSCVIPKVDSDLNVNGYAVYDSTGVRLPDGPEGQYVENSYVNGFYAVKSESGIQLVRAKDGKPVNDQYYEEVRYYEDGYCPVRKNGKWAYINESGAQVTDFIFQDASYAASDSAFVQMDGAWGMLNLARMNASVTEQNLSGWKEPAMGTLEIQAETINVRREPSTESEIISLLPAGEVLSYYEVKESEGYTWYRIGTGRWVASDGTWITLKD